MKPINNWNDVKAVSDRPKLPVGAYVCKIMGAEVKTYGQPGNTFEKLEVSIDICEGEYANFFTDDYRSQQFEDKKWGAVLRLNVPSDDGSDADNFKKRLLKTFIEAVEESNPGYHWDWNEKGLKHKNVGVIFRNEEWEWDGKTGWKVKPFKTLSVSDVQEGKYKLPEDKPLQNKPVNNNSGRVPNEQFASLDDADLPFEL